MLSVNISSMSITRDIVIAEYNQAELSKLEARISEQCLVTMVRLPGQLGLKCE